MSKEFGFIRKRKVIAETQNISWWSLNLDRKIEFFVRKKNNIVWYLVDLMINKNNIFLRFYPSTFDKSIKREINMAGISEEDRVLHIGCGPYPITATLISKFSGASVIAIDTKNTAIYTANRYLKKNKIKNVKIENGNAINNPMDEFDIIIVTSCITPRKETLDNIFNNAKNSCRIICREMNSTKNSIKNYISLNNGIIIDEIKHSAGWNSYLISKNN